MIRKEIDKKFDEIVAFAEIEKFIDTPVKRYSSGMYVRLAFGVAAHLEPEILLIDEVLAVGDAAFQKKCLGKMGDAARGGRTVLFVSHNMGAVQQLTNRSILLNNGNLLMDADTFDVVEAYLGRSVDFKVDKNLKTDIEGFDINSIGLNYDALEYGFNKPLQFDLKLFLKKETDNVHFGFMVVNSLGAKILTAHSTVQKLPSGTSDVSVILKDHRLPPGNYFINLGILISGILIFLQESVLRFEISDVSITNPLLTNGRDKIGVYLTCENIIH
jgi:lipopolysaccharide transport system ATP-binding protein